MSFDDDNDVDDAGENMEFFSKPPIIYSYC